MNGHVHGSRGPVLQQAYEETVRLLLWAFPDVTGREANNRVEEMLGSLGLTHQRAVLYRAAGFQAQAAVEAEKSATPPSDEDLAFLGALVGLDRTGLALASV